MYLGRIVEVGPVESIFLEPRHPYTIGLLKANPSIYAQRCRHGPAVRGETPPRRQHPVGMSVPNPVPNGAADLSFS
jgi:oligopeptide/dipeptide ABC transporter ATP-binding protein